MRRWARACADDLLLRVRRDDRGDQPVCQWRGAGAAPRAELVFTECEAGWLAWAMQHRDYVHQAAYSSTAGVGMLLDYRLPKRPSEYVRTQVKTTFMFDPVAIANRRLTGNECLLWGSDYPHQEGVSPHSQAAVREQFVGVAEEEIDQIVRTNGGDLWSDRDSGRMTVTRATDRCVFRVNGTGRSSGSVTHESIQ
jgi:hypothetical protein